MNIGQNYLYLHFKHLKKVIYCDYWLFLDYCLFLAARWVDLWVGWVNLYSPKLPACSFSSVAGLDSVCQISGSVQHWLICVNSDVLQCFYGQNPLTAKINIWLLCCPAAERAATWPTQPHRSHTKHPRQQLLPHPAWESFGLKKPQALFQPSPTPVTADWPRDWGKSVSETLLISQNWHNLI